MPAWILLVTVLTARPIDRPRRDRGASAVEYGLLIAGVAALIAVAVYAFGGGVGELFSDTCDTVANTATSSDC